MDPWKIRVNGMQTEVTGGTVGWNQLQRIDSVATRTYNGVTYVNNFDGSYTLTGTPTGSSFMNLALVTGVNPFIKDHVYFIAKGTEPPYIGQYVYGSGANSGYVNATLRSVIIKAGSYADPDATGYCRIQVGYSLVGVDIGTVVIRPMFFDLTQMFGSAIADHIYDLEQDEQGAGVAFFRELFPDEYYPYNAGELLSRSVDGIELRGMPALEDGEIVFPDADEYSNSGEIVRNWGIRAYEAGDESDPDVMTDGTNTLYELPTPVTEQGPSWTIPQALQEGSLETIRLFDSAPSSAFISFGADVRSLVIGCWYTPATAITAADTGNSWPAGAPARLTDFGYHDDGSCWARTSSGRFEIGNSKILNLWRVNN